jgi:hypothetical protein
MSHFTVLILDDDYEKALEPFDENAEVEFKDVEEEYREKYETGTVEMVRLANGELKYTWDDDFKNPDYKFGLDGDVPKHIYPADSVKEEIPFKEKYPEFGDYLEDWHGCSYDEDQECYGYWHNPQAKWDWYSVGGRWTGFFPLKKDATGVLGERGVFNTAPGKGRVDRLRIKDIDFDGERQLKFDEATKLFDEWEELLKEHDPKHESKPWSHFRETINDDATRDAAREAYGSQPLIKAVEEKYERHQNPFSSFFGCCVDEMGFDRVAFVKRSQESMFATHAVIKDGVWYQSGEMGWWGVVTDEKETDDWNKEFDKLLEGLPGETMVTLVDCHI